jgi:hypothetical protein
MSKTIRKLTLDPTKASQTFTVPNRFYILNILVDSTGTPVIIAAVDLSAPNMTITVLALQSGATIPATVFDYIGSLVIGANEYYIFLAGTVNQIVPY